MTSRGVNRVSRAARKPSSGGRMWRNARRTGVLLLACVSLLVAPSCLPASAGPTPQPPDWHQYTVELRGSAPGSGKLHPPANGEEAFLSMPLRARSIIQHHACGLENDFLTRASDSSNTTEDGLLHKVMAKLLWLKLGNGDCIGDFNVVYQSGAETDFFGSHGTSDNFLKAYTTQFPQGCGGAAFSVSAAGTSAPFARVHATVPVACLMAQIDSVLMNAQRGDAQPGTSGLPCNISYLDLTDGLKKFPTAHGDWDFTMKTLIRILFLDITAAGDSAPSQVLSSTARHHILYELINVSGDPSPDSYSWLDCGDNENDSTSIKDDVGAAQDLESEDSNGDEFFDDIGDIFSWFLKRLVLFAELAALVVNPVTGGALTAVAAVLASLAVLDGGAVVALGLAAMLLARIPETENHRLMIESTRFLKNQLVINTLQGNAPRMIEKQKQVKGWLLEDFQRIAKEEFIEYNARPYYRFVHEAIRNLADFATDPDVRTGAKMLIEYSAAKFAVGSNQGRRLAPFRRHFGVVACLDGNPCPDEDGDAAKVNNVSTEIFRDFNLGFADSGVSYGVLFNGQTQQLPFGNMSIDGAGDVMAAATTRFIPHPLIAQYAIRKQDFPYFQRIHHAAHEVYASSPSALITAGGVQTGHAYDLEAGPLTILITGIIDVVGLELQDLGAALPTTVIFTGAPVADNDTGTNSRMSLDHFIQFRGTRNDQHGEQGFDDNLCVWKNFACGTHIRIPPEFIRCLQKPAQPSPPHWYFFDSVASACGYDSGPKFYLAFYLICENDVCDPLPDNNAGFLEVADAPAMSLADFETLVMRANPPDKLGSLGQGCLSGGDCHGHYRTIRPFDSHDLEIALRGHQDDSNTSGILSVDGVTEKKLDKVNLAEGGTKTGTPPISSNGDGVITITNPGTGEVLTLDFSNVDHPCRSAGRIGFPALCVTD